VYHVAFVEKIAQKLSRMGLAMPAVLFLEAHKPLAFISSQFLLVAQPTLNLFVSPDFTQGMVDLLADPSQLEQLVSELEQRTSPNNNPSIQTPVERSGVQN
jgi:hypothetical protein